MLLEHLEGCVRGLGWGRCSWHWMSRSQGEPAPRERQADGPGRGGGGGAWAAGDQEQTVLKESSEGDATLCLEWGSQDAKGLLVGSFIHVISIYWHFVSLALCLEPGDKERKGPSPCPLQGLQKRGSPCPPLSSPGQTRVLPHGKETILSGVWAPSALLTLCLFLCVFTCFTAVIECLLCAWLCPWERCPQKW